MSTITSTSTTESTYSDEVIDIREAGGLLDLDTLLNIEVYRGDVTDALVRKRLKVEWGTRHYQRGLLLLDKGDLDVFRTGTMITDTPQVPEVTLRLSHGDRITVGDDAYEVDMAGAGAGRDPEFKHLGNARVLGLTIRVRKHMTQLLDDDLAEARERTAMVYQARVRKYRARTGR